MSRPSVVTLRQFYSSFLGRRVRAQVMQAMLRIWPELNGDMLLALGYATPFMRTYLRDEESAEQPNIFPAMPSEQSAVYWPSHRTNRTTLVDELALPYPNVSVNRIVMAHVLEHTPSERVLLEECWRVLVPGGRMLVLVPNRRSIWSRNSHTPFATGKPYSISQLKEVLCDDLFTHMQTSTVLHIWPAQNRTVLKVMKVLQGVLSLLFPSLGGLIVMEVEKQIYASAGQSKKRRTPAYNPVASKPAMTFDR